MNDRLDYFARAALGIGTGAMLAMLVSNTALAATVGLADADPIAVKVILMSIAIWVVWQNGRTASRRSQSSRTPCGRMRP